MYKSPMLNFLENVKSFKVIEELSETHAEAAAATAAAIISVREK